ncbi:coiled-coil domain-containing protein 173-like [Belonocnema kinseyi]|uniref:coiled-coil domain-containing protein 173-like n=1 Tax=Belonocnema kinseyi TaxID=2817044 RepID=UPI00143D8C3F|nr:coiled-coil domain-containing protein 173-like [Belonocnema kinseyi]
MYSIFYRQPVETLLEKKIYDRPLALVASKKSYDYFVDYTTEAYRMSILAEKEAKRLAEAKKATHEMSKTWDNTIENIKKQRNKELIAKSKKEDEDRNQFMKEMAEKRAAENLEVIKEARKLIFRQKPQCRLINRALLTSECLRELDAQIQFKKTLQGIDKEQRIESVERLKKDVEKFNEEEKKKAEELAMKNKIYAEELKKQMQVNESDTKRLEKKEKEAEKQDLINIGKELELMKKCELEEAEKRKKQLNELFLDALEKRKEQEIKIKRDQEFQERAMAVYNKTKRQIEKKLKMQLQKEKEDKLRRSEYLGKKLLLISAR